MRDRSECRIAVFWLVVKPERMEDSVGVAEGWRRDRDWGAWVARITWS